MFPGNIPVNNYWDSAKRIVLLYNVIVVMSIGCKCHSRILHAFLDDDMLNVGSYFYQLQCL